MNSGEFRNGIYRHVGVDRPYQTVQSAVDASDSKDTVVIDHGVYREAVYVEDKIVHFVGATPFPEQGGVRIISPYDSAALRISAPGIVGNLCIEGVHLESTEGNWQRGLEIEVPSASDSLNIYVNKCRMVALGKKFSVGLGTNPQFYLGGLHLTNCYLERGYSHTVYFDYINNSSISGTECNNPFLSYGGDPAELDTVYLPTAGYGPAYGDYIFPESLYYFKGHVLEDGTPVERKVRSVSRTSFIPDTKTTYSGGDIYHSSSAYSYNPFEDTNPSNAHPLGEFILISRYNLKHNIVAQDDASGLDYNDLIASNIYPIRFAP